MPPIARPLTGDSAPAVARDVLMSGLSTTGCRDAHLGASAARPRRAWLSASRPLDTTTERTTSIRTPPPLGPAPLLEPEAGDQLVPAAVALPGVLQVGLGPVHDGHAVGRRVRVAVRPKDAPQLRVGEPRVEILAGLLEGRLGLLHLAVVPGTATHVEGSAGFVASSRTARTCESRSPALA